MPPSSEILLLALSLSVQVASGDQCTGGSNIFTEILENSPNGTFVANLSVFGDPVTTTVKLCLSGTDADWFYLDGKNIWLNVSSGKTLDREALESSVLLVTLTCSEEGFPTVQYRIIVQVLNENDNKPHFLEESVTAQNISELAEVDSIVFTAHAVDQDGDTLMYVIDRTMGDFKYFHMDMPNNGKVLLSRPLDYESKQDLEIVIHAVEMTTRERQRTSVRVRVFVMDGDDQYPQFLPCHYMSHDGLNLCVSPTYVVNITEMEKQIGPLMFSPGPIFAEDGDKGIMAPISYSFLSGPDYDKFSIDNVTGVVSLVHPIERKLNSSIIRLKVMASQVGDPRKYSIAEVEVRVLAVNKHAPQFGSNQYQAFVQEGHSPAALVSTYNGQVLSLLPRDGDFPNETNPDIYLKLKVMANDSQLFQLTQSGLLIAKANRLQATETYSLQVIARDRESGETANCTVIVRVLAHGQAAPRDPKEPRTMFNLPDLPIVAAGLCALGLLLGVLLFLFIRIVKNRRQQQQQMSQTSLVTEKDTSVSLKWFQTVNPTKPSPQTEEHGYQNAAYIETPGEESLCKEKRQGHPVGSQSIDARKMDGQPGKVQKRAPAVAVISPGNQCAGASPCASRGKVAEPSNATQSIHQETESSAELHSQKLGVTQAMVTKQGLQSHPIKAVPVENSCLPDTGDQNPYSDNEEAEIQESVGLWPDPPVLSRLPIVVEVNEEVVEHDGEMNSQHPSLGSEIITAGSLMQLLDDSIEC
ncbi:cadherin-related family member 5-like [Spea bombifrons]|uniref:cadherin-related family member 5-like n=1 Tax=Spea bombifrons TaxID=233779 RepID=UPI0023493437|nr:cadherin-related family member 5-like [Spea bombifrons]